jgi:hypothetical protein
MMFGPTLPLFLVALPLLVGMAVALYGIASWFRRAPATIATAARTIATKATGATKAITGRTGSTKALTAPRPTATPEPIRAPSPISAPMPRIEPEPIVAPELSDVLAKLGEPTAVGLAAYTDQPEREVGHDDRTVVASAAYTDQRDREVGHDDRTVVGLAAYTDQLEREVGHDDQTVVGLAYTDRKDMTSGSIADIRATPPPAAVVRAASPKPQRAPTPAPRASTPAPRASTPAPRAATPRVPTPAPRAGTPPPREFDDDARTEIAPRSAQLAPSRLMDNVPPAKPKRPRAFAVGSEKFPVREDAEFDDAFDNAFDAVLGEPATEAEPPRRR